MNKKNIILIVIAVLFILCGMGLILYPYVSNYRYEQEILKEEEIFTLKISDKNNYDDFERLYQDLKKQNEELYESKQKNLTDPFSYEQPTINLDDYGIYNNIIGYIEIPKMEVALPIILGANKDNMAKGAVHLTQTSYPIGGPNTNCVIAAHRSSYKAVFFRNIDKLTYGDKIYIKNFKEELIYEVQEINIIDPSDSGKLLIRPTEDIISLITCHPYRINSQRYLVICKRAD